MKKILKKSKKQIFWIVLIVLVIGIIATLTMTSITGGIFNKEKYGANGDNTSTLIASNIKKGITIGGITGTLESLDTSDATATPEDILEGKTAYVNGVKIVGTRKARIEGAPIPKGFYYVGGTSSGGVIISDNKADENKYQGQDTVGTDDLVGNQFVWIPASGDNYHNSNDNQLYQIDSKIQEENQKIGESIQKYGGFYVSRFELANEGSNTVSKKGLTPSTNVTLQQAINNARAMYDDTNSELGVASTLIYGKQWDLVMDYIDDEYNVSDSTSYGNYYNFVRNTNNLNLALNNINNQIWKSFRQPTFKQAAWGSIIIETSTDKDNTIVEVPASGNDVKLNYTIKVSENSADAYVRFKIEGADYEDIQVANWIKKGEYYYYTQGVATGESITIPITLKISGNNTLNEKELTVNIDTDAVQYNNFTPDFSSDNPWGDIDIGYKSDETIKKTSYIEDGIKLAWFGDTDTKKIPITIKANTLENTGSNDSWKTKNIYDLAGNVEEWTIDIENNQYITRGGKYYDKSGSETPINSKSYFSNTEGQSYIGYRAILYVK